MSYGNQLYSETLGTQGIHKSDINVCHNSHYFGVATVTIQSNYILPFSIVY